LQQVTTGIRLVSATSCGRNYRREETQGVRDDVSAVIVTARTLTATNPERCVYFDAVRDPPHSQFAAHVKPADRNPYASSTTASTSTPTATSAASPTATPLASSETAQCGQKIRTRRCSAFPTLQTSCLQMTFELGTARKPAVPATTSRLACPSRAVIPARKSSTGVLFSPSLWSEGARSWSCRRPFTDSRRGCDDFRG